MSMEILQARIVEWVARPSSKGLSPPRDRTLVSCVFCITGGFFITGPLGKPQLLDETGEEGEEEEREERKRRGSRRGEVFHHFFSIRVNSWGLRQCNL